MGPITTVRTRGELTGYGLRVVRAEIDPESLSPDTLRLVTLLADRQADRVLALPGGWPLFAGARYEAELITAELASGNDYLAGMRPVPPGGVVLDVGAHIGGFSVQVLRHQPTARVLAVEPFAPSYASLEQNLRLHADASSVAVRAAVGAMPGTATIAGCRGGALVASIGPAGGADAAVLERTRVRLASSVPPVLARAGHGRALAELVAETICERLFRPWAERVRQTTVSDLMAQAGLTHIDVLKVDVEGSEYAVLSGIDSAHWPRIDAVVLETDMAAGPAIRDLLAERGFLVTVSEPTFRTADFGSDGLLIRAQRGDRPAPFSPAAAARHSVVPPEGPDRWAAPVAAIGALLEDLRATAAREAAGGPVLIDAALPEGRASICDPWLDFGILSGLRHGRSWARYLIERYRPGLTPGEAAGALPGLFGGGWEEFEGPARPAGLPAVVAARMSVERMIAEAARATVDIGPGAADRLVPRSTEVRSAVARPERSAIAN